MVGPQVGAGRFMVYPQPPTAPVAVAGGSTAELVLVEQLAGPAVDGLPYAQMMFVRIAGHGGDREPTFSIIAGSGDPVTVTSEATAVHRKPGGVEYVGDVWLDGGEPDGVYRFFVGFEAVSSERWRLRIHNNDTAECRFTAVVADRPGATLQPWIDVSPAPLSFDLLVGQTETKTVSVTNFGTTACTLSSVAPLPAALAVTTALPVDIPAAKAAALTVRFSAPAVPPAPGGGDQRVGCGGDHPRRQHRHHHSRAQRHPGLPRHHPIAGAGPPVRRSGPAIHTPSRSARQGSHVGRQRF
jgi:hypothetical protein